MSESTRDQDRYSGIIDGFQVCPPRCYPRSAIVKVAYGYAMSTVIQGALEGGLHLHIPKLGHGEVNVFARFLALFGEVIEEQLGQL